jgi:hypothetical protein
MLCPLTAFTTGHRDVKPDPRTRRARRAARRGPPTSARARPHLEHVLGIEVRTSSSSGSHGASIPAGSSSASRSRRLTGLSSPASTRRLCSSSPASSSCADRGRPERGYFGGTEKRRRGHVDIATAHVTSVGRFTSRWRRMALDRGRRGHRWSMRHMRARQAPEASGGVCVGPIRIGPRKARGEGASTGMREPRMHGHRRCQVAMSLAPRHPRVRASASSGASWA